METITVEVDGACRGNPGPTAVGYLLIDRKGRVLEGKGCLTGRGTNNTAEYQAALAGLKAASKAKATSVVLCSDSQLVVYQVKGDWACKDATLASLRNSVRALLKSFESAEIVWVPRAKQTGADSLAFSALKRGRDVQWEGFA